MTTLVPTITDAGISISQYADILASLTSTFKSIYGSDIYVDPDSQDGQLLAIYAQALYDSNVAAVSLYNSFSPTYAQGAKLSSLVKINGLNRNSSSASTAVGSVQGIAGTVINNGVVSDINGYQWTLPTTVTIPSAGKIECTVTCATQGSIQAPAGTINRIFNPQSGWQSFVNISSATSLTPQSLVVGSIYKSGGATITNGTISLGGETWSLISSLTVPGGGTLTGVVATAQSLGSYTVAIGDQYTSPDGWIFTATSASHTAALGAAVETDAELRLRQAVSTSLGATSTLSSILAAVRNVSGVLDAAIYENDTNIYDSTTLLPSHSMCVVVSGGSVSDIVVAIGSRKPPGISTKGNITGTYMDSLGIPATINYYARSDIDVYLTISVQVRLGYSSVYADSMKIALATFINSLPISEDVYYSQVMAVASQLSTVGGNTYYIPSIKLGRSASPTDSSDMAMAFNEKAICSISNITVSVS